jgi:hypothetical protein
MTGTQWKSGHFCISILLAITGLGKVRIGIRKVGRGIRDT